MKYIRNLWKEPILKVLEKCTSQSVDDPRAVEAFFEHGHIPHGPAWKCYIECCGRALGILSRTGDVDVDKWVEVFPYIDLPLAQECARIEESDVCEKAHMLVECAHGDLATLYPP